MPSSRQRAEPAKASLPRPQEVSRHFGTGTWQKGQKYAQQGAVLSAEVLLDEDAASPEFVISGEVQGSEMTPYDQSVIIWQEGPSQWVVDGDCSCPVGHNCKHVAALLCHVLEGEWFSVDPGGAKDAAAQAGQAYRQLDQWLGKAEDVLNAQVDARLLAMEASQQALAAASYRHLIVLDEVTLPGEAGAWLTLWPGQARRLKNKAGAFGKVTLPANRVGATLGPYDGQGEVFDALRRWHASQSYSATWRLNERASALPQHAIRDTFGAWVMERAARAGELVVLDAERLIARELQWGPAQALRWEWAHAGSAEDGSPLWQLRPHLASPTARLYMGDPLLYLDRDQGLCGLVDAQGATAAAVQRGLSAPPMPETWMKSHALRLTKLMPSLPESVRGRVARDVRGVAPVPHLAVRAHPDPRQAVFELGLSFDYDGIRGIWRIHDSDLQAIDTPQGRVQLWRDVLAEHVALTRLSDSGYVVSDPVSMATWQAMPGQSPAPHARDLAMLEADFAAWREAGFQIDMDEALRDHLMQAGEIDLGLDEADGGGAFASDSLDGQAGNAWFSLSLGFTVGGQRIDLLPWLPELIHRWVDWEARAQQGHVWPSHTWLTQEDGQTLRVPTEPLRPWMSAMQELAQDRSKALRAGEALRLDRYEAMRLATVDDAQGRLAHSVSAQDAKNLIALVAALRSPEGLPAVAPPAGLDAELRPYQQQGLAWMQGLARHRLGGILADDMGLGKTLQTIAHLLTEKQAGRLTQPALIVAPTSLVGNWRAEVQRFAPQLNALILHGSQRHTAFTRIADHDIVITTYPLLMRDEEVLARQAWSILVLDEAQTIKNAKTRAATIVQGLRARQRLCLSGTPMENHLGELWSLFHFVMPGYLGTEARFKQLFRTPIEKQGSSERLALLRARVAPFMLRRTKAAVASELPPKIETIEHIELPAAQANLYETIRLATESKVREALRKKGLAGSHITVLDALLKLRQVCCDPRLVPLEAARKVQDTAKIDWLMDNLPAMIEEGRRVLLFSQFTSMLALIEEALADSGIAWTKLTGQSKNREAIVARFTSGEVPLFLISLKAGGVGLNLPQADTVIHFDPWWNPAAEDQATDRAHRMGQQSTVFVYKLVAQGTVEERIVAMQARKAALAQGLHGDDAQADAVRLTETELDWLLQPIGAAATR